MDPGADAAEDAGELALVATRRATSLAPDAAAEALREALRGHPGDLTIADAAARSGLALRDAELGLHRLLQLHRGHLSVTGRGELLFRFPDGVARRFGRGQAALRFVGGAALGLVRWTARVGLTLFLLGYSLVGALALCVAALALAFMAEDGAPLEALGYLLYGMLELVGDALYWGFHPLRAPDEFAEVDEPQRPRVFYERVNGLFLGPPRRRRDPRAAARVLVAEIRARRGRIGLSDVVRVTGLGPEPAGTLVSRLLLDYDGEVDVSEEGAIVYRFPALRPSVGERVAAPPAIWERVRELPAFTGNPTGSNVAIVALTALVGALGWFGMTLGLPMVAAEIPLFGSLILLAWVLLRIPAHVRARRADRAENGRRALLRLAYEGAGERRGVSPEEFARAWREATGTEIAEKRLQALLIELGGDVVTDVEGRWAWRFPAIELERGALVRVRALASASEREVGAVEFTSLPASE